MMTNKKLIFGILVVIIVVGIGLSLFNRYGIFRLEITPTPTPNTISTTTTQTKVSIECPLDKMNEYVVITDSSSSLALSSRTILLEAGLSKQYLNEHFSFLCGIEYSSNNHRVAWKYVIGEYEGVLVGIINAPPNVGPKFNTIVGKLHDIQNVLSRTSAEKRTEQCLGEKPVDIRVILVGGPAPFPRHVTQPEESHNNNEGGLFMIGRTAPIIDANDTSVTHLKYGYLNLETEKCITTNLTSVVD